MFLIFNKEDIMRHALIAAREARDWTQEGLAKRVNVERTSIAKYESGKSDIPGRVLQRLADVLEIPMHVLYANGDKKNQLPLENVAGDPPVKITVKMATRQAKALQKQSAKLTQTLEELAHA
jgi:transcriptional regulator with XRE-family HTH domain